MEDMNKELRFVVYHADETDTAINAVVQNESIWVTQKAMADLFGCSSDNISVHLKNIYQTNELDKEATTEKISVVQTEGDRQVKRNVTFYNLDAIISVGYRVNSRQAKASAKQAKEKAESEYDIFNKTQKITSDFDREVQKMIEGNKGNA